MIHWMEALPLGALSHGHIALQDKVRKGDAARWSQLDEFSMNHPRRICAAARLIRGPMGGITANHNAVGDAFCCGFAV
jgi:hypothetical protein